MSLLKAYEERWGELDKIAHDTYLENRWSFLMTFCSAWMRADDWNKAILEPAWRKLIEKYGLEGSR